MKKLTLLFITLLALLPACCMNGAAVPTYAQVASGQKNQATSPQPKQLATTATSLYGQRHGLLPTTHSASSSAAAAPAPTPAKSDTAIASIQPKAEVLMMYEGYRSHLPCAWHPCYHEVAVIAPDNPWNIVLLHNKNTKSETINFPKPDINPCWPTKEWNPCIQSLNWSCDGKRLAIGIGENQPGRADGALYIYAKDAKVMPFIPTTNVHVCAWSPHNDEIIYTAGPGYLSRYSLASNKATHTKLEYEQVTQRIEQVVWSPNGNYFAVLTHPMSTATAPAPKMVHIWKRDGKLHDSFACLTATPSLCWKSDSSSLFILQSSGIKNYFVMDWNMATKEQSVVTSESISLLFNDNKTSTFLSATGIPAIFSPEHTIIHSAGATPTAHIWKLHERKDKKSRQALVCVPHGVVH